MILQSCRSFFVDGILPEINPYKYMGSPTAAAGVYSLTYPITYLSYAFSKFVLKQEYATIDVFCIFHLALAYFTAYFAAKVNHVKTSLCMVFALFYSLSGFSLVAVRSWYYMTPITAFAPLFVISLNYLKEKGVNFKWIILTGCLIGVTAYAGNIQMLAYMCLFFILAVVIFFLTQTINKFNFMSSFLPFILGAAIAFPLIFVSLDLLKDVVRNHGNTDSICYEYFYTMFVPYFALPNKDFTLAESFLNNYGQFFYSGSLFVIISFMGVFFAVVTPKRDGFSWSSLVSCNIYILLGLIALILSFGDYGLLWNILHSLPFFNKFICPEKMMLFINLFLNLGGVIILNRFFAKRKGHLEKGLLLFLLIVLFLHLKYSTQAFFKYDVYPYPDFGQIERAIPDIKQHRIYSVSPRRSESKSYLFALNNDIPSVSGIMSVCGYDSKLEDILPENLGLYTILCSDNSAYDSEKASSAFLINYLGQMGVKYVIYMESESQLAKSFPSSDYKLVYELDNIKYYSLKNYYPLSYIEVSKKTLPILYNSKGAVVDASEVEAGQSVIINMIWHKNYKAYAGNKEVPVHRDSYGRIRIILPEKVEKIVLKYTSPWGVGFIISLILFILFIISLIVYKLKNK